MINDHATFKNYVHSEKQLHARKVKELGAEKMQKYRSTYNKWTKRTGNHWETLTKKNIAIHDSFLVPYSISFSDFFESGIMQKYQIRGYNCLRELLRTATLCPELLDKEKSYEVLELSSGSCANYEVLTQYNNKVDVTDYLGGRGSSYQPIHRWLNIDVLDFDGSQLPYVFENNSYDYILCYQAIDAYGTPEFGLSVVEQLARVARKKIVLVLNPFAGTQDVREHFQNAICQRFEKTTLARCPDTNHPTVIIEVVQ